MSNNEIDAFRPAAGLGNRHLQTMIPVLSGRSLAVHYTRQELTLEDGDFVDLDWTAMPDRASRLPIVVLFHGLGGDSQSHYTKSLMQAVASAGWVGVVMNFRGCSGRRNKAPRLYHSGETGDAGFFIDWLRQQFPLAPLFAAGFSLGGNMLLKLAGEQKNTLALSALVSVSAPVKLDESTRHMMKGLPRIYQAYLLKALKRKFLQKFPDHDYKSLIDVERQDILKCKDIREFDHLITARLHGFTGAEDYYQQSSAYPYIEQIEKPCLILHANDDPIAPSFILPDSHVLPQQVTLEVTEKGGHVGFLGGTIARPHYWLADRIMHYFSQQQRQG